MDTAMLMNAAGRRLHYDDLGPRDRPVVCMAHTLSSDAGVWSEQVPDLLAAGWRVLRPDMRGHGGSEHGSEHCTISDLAGDVILLLDHLGIDKVHFIGCSIGGMIGQVLGIEHPDRVQSLMLCGTSPKAVPGGNAMWQARFSAIEKAGSVEPLAEETMVRWFTDDFRARRTQRLRQVRDMVANTTPAGYITGARAIIAFDVLGALTSVNAPTLVLCGDQDSGTPPEGNRTIGSLIPGARYVEMSPARHIPMIEHPERFNAIMMDWLNEQRSR